MRKVHSVLILIGVVVLTYLVYHIGGGEIWRQLKGLGWGLIPLVLGEGVANLAHTAGWRHCLSGHHRSLPIFRLFRMAMAGFAINYLTPSASLGGELSKAALLTSSGGRGPDAVSSVLIDKFCIALAHLLLVVGGSFILVFRVELPVALRAAMLVTTILMVGGIGSFMLIQKYGKLGAAIRWLSAHKVGGRALVKAEEQISQVDESMKAFYRQRPWDLLSSVSWHVVGHSVIVAQTWLFLALLHQSVSFLGVFSACILCLWFDLLTFAVPMNLGALEGSRLMALKAVGCSALQGMTFGVIMRIAMLFWAAFGLACYGLLVWGERRAKPGSFLQVTHVGVQPQDSPESPPPVS